jgi:hypothetical protein
LGGLLVWLIRQFPYSEDPPHEGAYAVGPRDTVAAWRDTLLHYLKSRGTPSACDAIDQISREFPDLDWLKGVLLKAQEVRRRVSWVPPSPEALLKLTRGQDGRFVQGGGQLLDVLIESLKRLESKLQGATPAGRDLWDKLDNLRYRPIEEESLSDYVKRHLEADLLSRGIIVNREVQIRRGEGTGLGERTDIQVDAITHGQRSGACDSMTAIIEVKGCWNSEILKAMETQLAGRYLKDSQCHGLYLVGWFECRQWDPADPRKKRSANLDLSSLQSHLQDQASHLSG